METCFRVRGMGPSGLATVTLLVALVAPVRAPAHEPPADATARCASDRPVMAVAVDAELSMGEAVAAALVGSPDLAADACEIRVRDAHLVQAGLFVNPRLNVVIEDVAGTGDRSDDDAAETTLLLSQLFELGGERRQRIRNAGLARDLAVWSYEGRRLSVVGATVKAFIHALAAQEQTAIADDRVALAERTARDVARRVEAGASPAVDATRARVAAGRAEVARQRAARDLAAARRALAATWGSERARFTRVTGGWDALAELLTLAGDDASVDTNPDVARWETERAQRKAEIALAQAAAVPDITLGAGGRYYSDNGDHALVVQLQMPLPVFDWGQGRVGIAEHRLARAHAQQHATERSVALRLLAARDRLATARAQAALITDRLLPDARRAVDDADAAFRRGLIDFTDLLDVELTAFELRDEETRALEEMHLAAVDVARLVGASPVELASPPGE